MRNGLHRRLERALAASASAAAAMGASAPCGATIVYSGPVNISLPSTVDGVYINLITLQTANSGLALPSWDLNPYHFQGAQFFGNSAAGVVTQSPGGPALNALSGTIVGPGSSFSTGIASGINFSPLFPGKVAFRFLNEFTGQTNFGWANLLVPGQGQPGVLYDYYYDNSGNSVVVDFPAAGSAWPLAIVGVAAARRRRA